MTRIKTVELQTARDYESARAVADEYKGQTGEAPHIFALRQEGGLKYYLGVETPWGESTLSEWTEQATAHWAPGE